jgi:oxygen-independent coproporphyrinogen III oxidase
VAGIYIHIPFCRQACHYCDFHFSTNLTNKENLVSAICSEIALSKDFLEGEPIETIYFGGGSPSLLSSQELDSILSAISANYTILSGSEITFEGNPDDLNLGYLKEIASLGINRLSIGIQSFDEQNLKFLNRVHNALQSKICLEDVEKAGFSNFSIDLIYGIPAANHKKWLLDITEALNFKPKHISAYCLTIEEKTAFGNWLKKGKISPIDNDFAAEQYEILVDRLRLNGYEQYEISNFAIPAYYSKHNSSYWRQKKYLGLGPGAHSFNGEKRRFNIENNNKYVVSINKGIIPFVEENLTQEDKINEFILTTLRTKWGTNLRYLNSTLGIDILGKKKEQIEKLSFKELIRIENNSLFLTEKGKLLADEITEQLMVDKAV